MNRFLIPAIATLTLVAMPVFAQQATTTEPSTQSMASGSANASSSGEIQLAQARSYLDVVAELQASGYTVNSIGTTLLGRILITVQNDQYVRQVVVSRSTGETLSDEIVTAFAQSGATGTAAANSDASANGAASGGASVGAGIGLNVGGGNLGGTVGGSGGGSVGGSVGGGIGLGN